MNHSRTGYWAVRLEVWSGTLIRLKEGWWKKPETIKLFRVCKSPEEAKILAKEMNK